MASIRRDEFEIYKNGVKRLQELSRELNALHAEKKFPVEVASITAKLKNVSELPQIELELNDLKKKISGRFTEKKIEPRKVVIHTDKKEIEHLKEDIDEKVKTINSFSKLKSETELLKLKIEQLEKTEEDIKEKFEKAKLKPVNAQLKNIKQDFDRKISGINVISKIKDEIEELRNKIYNEESGKTKNSVNLKNLEGSLGLLRKKVNSFVEEQKSKLSKFISKEEFNALKKEFEDKTVDVASNTTIAGLRVELDDLRKNIEKKIENVRNNPALNAQFELVLDRIESLEDEENSQRNKGARNIGVVLMLKNQIEGLKNLVKEFSEREESEIKKLQSEYSISAKKTELEALKEEVEGKIKYATANPILRKNLNELKAKIEELDKQEKLKSLEDVKESSKKEIKISKLRSEIEFLRERIAEEEIRLERTESASATKTELERLKEEVEGKIKYATANPVLRKNLNELKEKIEELDKQEKSKSLEDVKESSKKEIKISRLKNETDSLKFKIEQLEMEEHEMLEKISSVGRNAVTSQLKNIKQDFDKRFLDLNSINRLKSEIAELKNNISLQEQERPKDIEMINNLENKLSILKKNVNDLIDFETVKINSLASKKELQDLRSIVESKIKYVEHENNSALSRQLKLLLDKIAILENEEKEQGSKEEISAEGILKLKDQISALRNLVTKLTENEDIKIRELHEGAYRLDERTDRLYEITARKKDIESLKQEVEEKIRYATANPTLRKNLNELKEKIIELEKQNRKIVSENLGENAKKSLYIRRLNSEIKHLSEKVDIQEKTREKKEKLLKNFDPFVDSISSNMFSLSLDDIKLRLAEEFRRREEILKEEVRKELEKKREEYLNEYKKVEKRLSVDYNKRLAARLAIDAKKGLAEMAEELAEKKTAKIHQKDLDEFRRKKEIQLELEKKKLTESFISDFENAKNRVRKDYEKQMQIHHKELDIEFAKKTGSEIEKFKNEYHQKMADIEHRKKEELAKIKERESRLIIEKKELDEAIVSKIEELEGIYNKKSAELEAKKRNEIETLHRKENEFAELINRTKRTQNEFEKRKKELEQSKVNVANEMNELTNLKKRELEYNESKSKQDLAVTEKLKQLELEKKTEIGLLKDKEEKLNFEIKNAENLRQEYNNKIKELEQKKMKEIDELHSQKQGIFEEVNKIKKLYESKINEFNLKKEKEMAILTAKEGKLDGLNKELQEKFENLGGKAEIDKLKLHEKDYLIKLKELESEKKKNSLLISDMRKKLSLEYEKRLNGELSKKENEFKERIKKML